MKFQAGQSYGNDLTIKVIKRTEKTVTFETNAWGVKRAKIKEYTKGVECIYFKAWIVTADEIFDKEEAAKISYEKSYN